MKTSLSESHEAMKKILKYLDKAQNPSLKTLAAQTEMSLADFQNAFPHWIGMTPECFLKGLQRDFLWRQIQKTAGRFCDFNLTLEAANADTIHAKGKGLWFRFGFARSLFGKCFFAENQHGICEFRFILDTKEKPQTKLFGEWRNAKFDQNDDRALRIVKQIFQPPHPDSQPLQLWVKASPFQFQVWKSLLHLPRGRLTSYRHLGDSIGKSSASRAIGNAVSANPIAILIPCHRVIRSNGDVGKYRWGTGRKRALIAWESSSSQGF